MPDLPRFLVRRTCAAALPALLALCGCRSAAEAQRIAAAVADYRAASAQRTALAPAAAGSLRPASALHGASAQQAQALPERQPDAILLFGVPPHTQPAADGVREVGAAGATGADGAPDGYWRATVWNQMGREGLNLGKSRLWDGFRVAFWDPESALILTTGLGGAIALRQSGVDGTVEDRTKGHRQLGDFDEPIQLLGHPGTHFAGASVLWLSSTLTRDMKQHEVSKTLIEALAVNGITTMLMKVSFGTTAPNGDGLAFPSGHTSSAFTAAAVLSEYYGPWVGVPSLALAGLVGYQRIDSRVHDFSDVTYGALLGYMVGSAIAQERKVEFPELFGMKVLPYSDPQTGAAGLALYKSWK